MFYTCNCTIFLLSMKLKCIAIQTLVISLEQGNVVKAITSDSAFHQLIAKISRNRTLNVLMKTMDQTLKEGLIANLNTPGRLELTHLVKEEIQEDYLRVPRSPFHFHQEEL